jgi:hypothetical protein
MQCLTCLWTAQCWDWCTDVRSSSSPSMYVNNWSLCILNIQYLFTTVVHRCLSFWRNASLPTDSRQSGTLGGFVTHSVWLSRYRKVTYYACEAPSVARFINAVCHNMTLGAAAATGQRFDVRCITCTLASPQIYLQHRLFPHNPYAFYCRPSGSLSSPFHNTPYPCLWVQFRLWSDSENVISVYEVEVTRINAASNSGTQNQQIWLNRLTL